MFTKGEFLSVKWAKHCGDITDTDKIIATVNIGSSITRYVPGFGFSNSASLHKVVPPSDEQSLWPIQLATVHCGYHLGVWI